LDAVVRQCQVQDKARADNDFPPMMVYSLPTPFYLDRSIDHWLMERTIIGGLRRLEAMGVASIAILCNTAHIYFGALARSGLDGTAFWR
jgi:aspartate racemase